MRFYATTIIVSDLYEPEAPVSEGEPPHVPVPHAVFEPLPHGGSLLLLARAQLGGESRLGADPIYEVHLAADQQLAAVVRQGGYHQHSDQAELRR